MALLNLELFSIRAHTAALATSLALSSPGTEPTSTSDAAGGPWVPAAPVTCSEILITLANPNSLGPT